MGFGFLGKAPRVDLLLIALHASLSQTALNRLVSSALGALALRYDTRQTRRVLIGLFSELEGTGGVQRASRHMAAVLSEFAANRHLDCRLLSLNDTPELHRMSVGAKEFVFTGSERSKARFTATAVRAAHRHAKVVLAGHPVSVHP